MMFLMIGILMILVTDFREFFSIKALKTISAAELFTVYIAVAGTNLSFCNVFLITVDRYIATDFPLKHRIWVTKPRAKIGVGIIWCFNVLPSWLFNFLPNFTKVATRIYGGLVISACVALLFWYCCIVRKFANIQRERQAWNTQHNATDRTSKSKQQDLIIRNAIAVTCCFICYIPLGLHRLLGLEKWLFSHFVLWVKSSKAWFSLAHKPHKLHKFCHA